MRFRRKWQTHERRDRFASRETFPKVASLQVRTGDCQKADMLRYSITSSARPKGAEIVSPRASTVQSLAFRQASQVFGIGGGSAPTRREKSPRGATSPPSR